MIPKDLFQKIRRIEITTSRLVTDVFAGQYHSVFKGQGIEFDEVREYQPGDDVRRIDWNVTARTGRPHIKKFIEERELTVMVMVDVSLSARYGSRQMLKSQLAAEVSALLALAAIRNNDKVGLIIFTDKIEKFIPPRKGKKHVLRVIREVLYYQPEGHGTDITKSLEYLNHIAKRRTISFMISDFFDPRVWSAKSGYQDSFLKQMAITHKRHDLIAITLNDPLEQVLPDSGIVAVHDAETGRMVNIDTSDKQTRQVYTALNQQRLSAREKMFRRLGMDFIDIATDQPYANALTKFFLKRQHR